jgi:hypothetical protein
MITEQENQPVLYEIAWPCNSWLKKYSNERHGGANANSNIVG